MRRPALALAPLAPLSAAFLAFPATFAHAYPQPQHQPQPAADTTQLPSTIELPRLLDLAAARLGISIEYDTKLTGSVTLRLNDALDDTTLRNLTNRLLASRDFTTIRVAGSGHVAGSGRSAGSGTLSVVPLASAAGLAAVEDAGALASSAAAGVAAGEATEEAPGERSEAAPEPGFRVIRVQLLHRRPEDVAAALKPLLSPKGGAATPLPELRSLLVADLTPRLPTILEAIAAMEAGGPAPTPIEIPLARIAAAQLISLAEQIEASRAASGGSALRGQLLAGAGDRSVLIVAPEADLPRWRDLITRLDEGEPLRTVTYDVAGLAASEVAASVERLIGAAADPPGLQVAPDEFTGSIVVTGTSYQHDQVAALLERLADSPAAARRPSRTFRLANRDAEEVLGVLRTLIAAGLLGPPQGELSQPGQDPLQGTSLQGVPGFMPGMQSRTPTPNNTSWATPQGAPPYTAPGAVPLPGVSTGLQLAADPATNSIIAIGEAQELTRLEQLLADLDVRRPQVLLEVLIVSLSESDSLDLGVEIEALINGPNDTIAKLSSLFGLSGTGAGSDSIGDRGAGLTGIVLNPGDFSVVLRALKSLNEGRSLSMPKVLVASNEEASINSVLEQPYTTINASDTVATTSFGGASNAGTEVSVRPQIAEGDHLRLEYSVSLSAFVGEAADASVPPPRQQNNIDSVATIPDGYTIAVGGIELVTEGESETGIPFLSDVPVLGEAFKNRSKSGSRSRFYVFIRSTILRDRDFEDLKYLSDVDVAGVGVDDGWPEPQPRFIR